MIDQKIKNIENHFLYNLEEDPRQNSISLLSGKSGTVLFFIEKYNNTNDPIYRDKIFESLELLVNKMDQASNLGSTFCDGLAGWGWMIEKVKCQGLINDEFDDILEDVDEILENKIDDLVLERNFDLFHGLLGIGIYFLKRKKLKIAEKILINLGNISITDYSEVRFLRFDPSNLKNEIFDLGLPHGMVGTLYFVRKCYELSINIELSKKILFGIVQFYMNNVQKNSLQLSFFASRYAVTTYKSGHNEEVYSRMAWCYGDPIVLYSLLETYNVLKLNIEKNDILDMLIVTSKRKSFEQTNVSDPTFCHGTTGLAYLFLKLYKKTSIEDFKQASDFWLEKTLNLGNEDGYGGYLFEASSEVISYKKVSSSGILEGIGGVGLTLYAFKYPESNNTWDECLFLS